MAGSLQLLVYDKQQKVYQDEFAGPVELGRQRDGREVLYSTRRDGPRARLVIARLDEDTVSRDHALIEPVGDRVKLSNTSAKVSIRLSDGSELKAGQSTELTIPTVIALGKKHVRIQKVDRESGPPLRGLAEATLPPGSLSGSARFPTQSIRDIVQTSVHPNSQIEEVFKWLQTTMEVLQSAANSASFFEKAAQAVVDIVGLDRGRVLIYEDGEWENAATWTAPQCSAAAEWRPSRHVLDRVLQEKRTFWQDPEELELDSLGS